MGRQKNLLSVDVEVDFDLGLGGFGVGGEAPLFYCVLCSRGEQGVARLYLGVGDGAVGLDGDQKYDLAADVHTVGELGIDRLGAGDYGSMDATSEGRASAEEETSCEKERAGRTG
jgi:hypothetical protein